MISASAFGLYLYILSARPSISAKKLSKTFNEGRDAIATLLRELRELGLIQTKKVHINGRIMTISNVVEPGFWTPETRLLLQQCKPNSQLAYTPYSLITYCINSFANCRTEVRQREKKGFN
jgi:hypothetical protein